jgi:hypothetical protein
VSSERVERLRELAEMWNRGEVGAFMESVGPRFELTTDPSFPDSDTFSGEGLRSWMRGWIETWKQNELELLEIEDRGRAVVARCRWHLLATEKGAEVPISDFTLLLFFEDGEPRRMLAFFDHELAEAALAERS